MQILYDYYAIDNILSYCNNNFVRIVNLETVFIEKQNFQQ